MHKYRAKLGRQLSSDIQLEYYLKSYIHGLTHTVSYQYPFSSQQNLCLIKKWRTGTQWLVQLLILLVLTQLTKEHGAFVGFAGCRDKRLAHRDLHLRCGSTAFWWSTASGCWCLFGCWRNSNWKVKYGTVRAGKHGKFRQYKTKHKTELNHSLLYSRLM